MARLLTQARIRSGLFRVRASLRARARCLLLAISPAAFNAHDTGSPADFSAGGSESGPGVRAVSLTPGAPGWTYRWPRRRDRTHRE